SDKEGRFEIRGIGRERLVELDFAEQTIERVHVNVMTRPSDSPVIEDDTGRIQYGAEFVHVAASGRSILGFVVDERTGGPIGGVALRDGMLCWCESNTRGAF